MNNQIALYQKYLDLPNAEFVRIDHHDAMVAVVYKITQPNGQQLILKISDRVNDYHREIYFLKLFANILPIPRIIKVVPPSDQLHGAILMECLPGALLEPEELTEKLAFDLGANLGRIHAVHLKGYGDPLHDNLSTDPREYFTFKFEEGLNECIHNLTLTLINKCRRYFDSSIDLLKSADGPCAVHRDFRPGNLMVQNGKLQGVIDWAGARASFAEEDFCTLDHGDWLNNAMHKKSFLQGYETIRPVPNYQPLISFLRLNKAIATIGFTVKRGTWNNANAPLYEFNRNFVETLLV